MTATCRFHGRLDVADGLPPRPRHPPDASCRASVSRVVSAVHLELVEIRGRRALLCKGPAKIPLNVGDGLRIRRGSQGEGKDDDQINPGAEVSPEAQIGDGTKVWSNVQIRDGRAHRTQLHPRAQRLRRCRRRRRRQRQGAEQRVALRGGDARRRRVHRAARVFTNDKVPRGINADGSLKSADDWVLGNTHVRYGAAIGAGTVVVTGVTIGRGRWSARARS